jgi:hypothetical protein
MKMAMGRHPAVDVVVPGLLLTEVCKCYYEAKTASCFVVGAGVDRESGDPRNAIYISDLEDKPAHLALLLVRGDPGRKIPGFVNPVERVVATATSDPGFVPGASCHLVISKQEIATGTDHGRFRMAMEVSRGIGRALARDFLGTLLSRYASENPDKFVAEKKRRSKKEGREQIAYRPTVRFHPQMNGSLKKDLEEGRIGGFKLTRGTTKFKGSANEAALQKLDVQLKASIAPTKDFSRVKRLVDHLQQSLDAISFEALNLELVDDGGNLLDHTKAIELDSLDDDLRYSKLVPIPDLGKLDECYGRFHKPIKDYAIKALQIPGYWG